jgi:hypothetical protein
MKKILFLILFGFSSVYGIDERVIDFYFGNGIMNSQDQAKASKDELEKLISGKFKQTFLTKNFHKI